MVGPGIVIIVLPSFLILGIRGEINVLVKVELFNDLNRFRQSSCGVKFFCSACALMFIHKLQTDFKYFQDQKLRTKVEVEMRRKTEVEQF